MRRPQPAVQIQLAKAGYLAVDYRVDGPAVRLTLDKTLRRQLDQDERFACGWLYGLHRDVGEHLKDYRSDRGAFGAGSLQIVVDVETGNAYSDVDGFTPYQDVVNLIGHTGEVIAGWWRGWRS